MVPINAWSTRVSTAIDLPPNGHLITWDNVGRGGVQTPRTFALLPAISPVLLNERGPRLLLYRALSPRGDRSLLLRWE